jgi:hypothetical protein
MQTPVVVQKLAVAEYVEDHTEAQQLPEPLLPLPLLQEQPQMPVL